jgi:hypothetical protein
MGYFMLFLSLDSVGYIIANMKAYGLYVCKQPYFNYSSGNVVVCVNHNEAGLEALFDKYYSFMGLMAYVDSV